MSHSFDMTLVYDGEEVRVKGTIDPGEPETGPTWDCGGTPGCGPSIDDFNVFRGDGSKIEDTDGKIFAALEDEILRRASEDAADDAASAAEDAADARRDSDAML